MCWPFIRRRKSDAMEKCTRFALRDRGVCCCARAARNIGRQTSLRIAGFRLTAPTAYRKPAMSASVLVFVLVFVDTFFFDNIQFDRIESNYFKLGSTLFTSH